jgi:ribose/xylose/arabinose/galactoside ABC-type transport system permease subunit
VGALYYLFHVATRAGVPSIIATLAGLLLSRGLSTIIQACTLGAGEFCRGSGAGNTSGIITAPAWIASLLDSLPFNLAVAGVILLALSYWRFKMRSGLEHVAVGMNEAAATFARIRIDRVRLLAFMVAAGLVFTATLLRLHGQNNGGWAPNTGWGEELIAIAIAVVGGTRVSGGHFDPPGIVLAGATVYVWRDIITNDLGVPTEATSMLFGILLLVISWTDLRTNQVRVG